MSKVNKIVLTEKYANSIDYVLGETVYLKIDSDQLERIVASIAIRATGNLYELSQGTKASFHYSFEISQEKDVVKKTEE
ncbi:MAG: hypothetical protein ACFB15_25775 [Cyclobacteriaceae bacterium]